MPEKETTYYEIALSARQVLVTFIVALTCISLAFFAGLWVGQQDEGKASVADTATAREDEGAPALGFFTDSGDDGAADAEPIESGAAREGRAVEEPQPTEESDEPPAAEPRRSEPSRDTGSVSQGQAAPSGSVILQVLASSNRATAENTLASLRDAGHNAYLQPIDRGDSTLYRVRVGPFADRAAAESAKRRVDDALNVEALITTAE